MPSLKEVRSRIASIKSTRQITSAMKMVSASKLRRSQNAIMNLRPYSAGMKALVDNLEEQFPLEEYSSFCRPNSSNKVLVIAISSNKGLCGTYNMMLIKRTLSHLDLLKKENKTFELFLAGKKVEEYFREHDYIVNNVNNNVLESLSFKDVEKIAEVIMEQYHQEKFGRVDVVYNYFRNAIMQQLVVEQLLPVPFTHTRGEEKMAKNKDFSPLLEPSPGELIEELIPKFIKNNLYRILLDASASEHGARMTAMHKASDNATELLKNLSLTYNKVRQSMITREIMEIVSGAEVFNQ